MIVPVALLLGLGAAPSAPSTPVVEQLADGTQLVVAQMKGARTVSLRYVVRAGAADEPSSRAGLAHLLEHVVLHGTYMEPEGALFDAVHAAGGTLNAHTSADWTAYEIDVPSERFADTAPKLLGTVTSPALPFAELEREKGVVEAEQLDRGDVRDWLWAIDHLVYPSANAGINIIGTTKSREAITVDDLQQFIENHYVPHKTVIIVVGDVEVADVRTLVERALLNAPVKAPAGGGAIEPETPNIPSQAKVQSFVTLTLHARKVDGVDRAACDTAAAVLGLRVRQALVVDEGISASTGGYCVRARGHQLLVLAALSSSPDSSSLPELMREVARRSATVPPNAREQAVVTAWSRAQRTAATRSPAAFADTLVRAVGQPGIAVDQAVKEAAAPPKLSFGSVTKVFALAAPEDNLAEIHFSRFEQ